MDELHKIKDKKIKDQEEHIKELTKKLYDQLETIRALKNCVEFYANEKNYAGILVYTELNARAKQCLEKLGMLDE